MGSLNAFAGGGFTKDIPRTLYDKIRWFNQKKIRSILLRNTLSSYLLPKYSRWDWGIERYPNVYRHKYRVEKIEELAKKAKQLMYI